MASDGTSTYTWDPSGITLVGVGAAGGGSGVLALNDQHTDVVGAASCRSSPACPARQPTARWVP